MGSVEWASPVPTFSDRLFSLFQKIDYRVAATDEQREAIFRLRYDAYEREKAILPSFSKRLSDRYDDLDNTISFALEIDGQLAATMRISVATAEYPECPALAFFPDKVSPMLEAGKILIDPTRHATNEYFSRLYSGLMPFLTTRIAWMASSYFNADVILASVRLEHQAFYRRIFGCTVVCEPRPYPPLIKQLSLMTLDFRAQKDTVQRRYPSFLSTLFERRMMFESGFDSNVGWLAKHRPSLMSVG